MGARRLVGASLGCYTHTMKICLSSLIGEVVWSVMAAVC